MAYSPENNPYIPGDPYSYDLKWIIEQIRSQNSILNTLDLRIKNEVIKALAELNPVVYETAADLIDSIQKAGTLAYIMGYHKAGDNGAMLYYITDDYNEIILAPFYITLSGANRWALPVIITPYITPEMFGAYGNGIEDDTPALQLSLNTILIKGTELWASRKYRITDTLSLIALDRNQNKTINICGLLLADFNDRPLIDFSNFTGWKITVNAQDFNGNYFGGYDFEGITNFHYGLLPYVGVILRNVQNCSFNGILRNFNVGLRLEGLGEGCVYNSIHDSAIWNCAYGIEMYANTGGWVNSNFLTNNRVALNSGITNRDKAISFHMFSSYSYPSNCNYIQGDFIAEEDGPVVLIENGKDNTFRLRNEDSNTALIDSGSYNEFITEYDSTLVMAPGSNTSGNAITKLIRAYKLIANVEADAVDILTWRKSGGSTYGGHGNLVDYGTYDSGNFTDEFYFSSSDPIDGIPRAFGIFADIKQMGSIIVHLQKLNPGDTCKLCIYLFDENKDLIEPADGYAGGALRSLEVDSSKHRLWTSGDADDKLYIQNFTSAVKYIFVTANAAMKKLTLWAKQSNTQIPGIAHYTDKPLYPYGQMVNSYIKTSKPWIGKRVYSAVDAIEYICTAVAADGTETWTAHSI